jgi:hypothetical protein
MLSLSLSLALSQATLRFFDILFLEGNRALFRIALSLFKIHEANVLAATDFDELFVVLKGMCTETDAERLIEVAFDKQWIGSLNRQHLSDLRKKYFQIFWRQEMANKAAASRVAPPPERPMVPYFSIGSSLLASDDQLPPPPPPTVIHRPRVPAQSSTTYQPPMLVTTPVDDYNAYRPALDAYAPLMPSNNPYTREFLCL